MGTLSEQFTLLLPDYWTPQQALAVYELLNELTEAIWNHYQIPMIELLTAELDLDNTSQLDLFDFNDSIPF